jgi:hypothetical protein
MTDRNLLKQLSYSNYVDMATDADIESIDYRALIEIIDDLYDKIETLQRDNEILKSYMWER